VGRFYYNQDFTADFDDRLLAHLQIVIGSKLRRGEAFYFSWHDDHRIGNGRTTIWMHPSMPIRYKYNRGIMPPINPAWIQELTVTANSSSGLRLVNEPAPPTPPLQA
jgi:hypothetical protein